MVVRLTRHARLRARRRRIPLELILETYGDPDVIRPSQVGPDREVRRRTYHGRVIEIVVDTIDGSVVTVWMKQDR